MSDLTRSVPFELTRTDNADTGDGLTMTGYAAVFNAPTRIDSWEGTFDEQIRAGAFKKTIRERTPVIQFDHGAHPMIGSIPIGSISDLREDDQGLYIESRLSDNWLIAPIRDAIANGSINGMSFRFQPVREIWTDQVTGKQIRNEDEIMQRLYYAGPDDTPLLRTITELRMAELGPVVFPAYTQTSVSVRAAGLASKIKADATKRRAVLRSIAGDDNDAAPFDDNTPQDLVTEVARAILFGSPTTKDAPSVEDTRPTDTPLSDEHLSRSAEEADESKDTEPVADEVTRDSETETVSYEVVDRIKRDFAYRADYLSLIMKGSEKYER